jgi:hypothetical protein
MKIAYGVNNQTKNIANLKKFGITEVYCGYIDKAMAYKWPEAFLCLNRRGEGASFYGKKEFRKFAQNATLPIYVTFNTAYYGAQYPYILRAINYVSGFSAVKGIIVSDMGLLLRLKKINYKKDIVISTTGTVFNFATVDFYKQFKIKKIILNSQLKPSELLDIIEKHPDMEFELFGMRGPCVFIDGFCFMLHCTEKKGHGKSFLSCDKKASRHYCGCKKIGAIRTAKKYKVFVCGKEMPVEDSFVYGFPHGCNLCSFYALRKHLDKLTLKIVSRGDISDSKTYNVLPRFKALVELSQKMSKTEYESMCKKFFLLSRGKPCSGRECYTPKGAL